jgi:hypothetical protein
MMYLVRIIERNDLRMKRRSEIETKESGIKELESFICPWEILMFNGPINKEKT